MLAIPAKADGVSVVGDWDLRSACWPGLRACCCSRTCSWGEDAVPDAARYLFFQARCGGRTVSWSLTLSPPSIGASRKAA